MRIVAVWKIADYKQLSSFQYSISMVAAGKKIRLQQALN